MPDPHATSTLLVLTTIITDHMLDRDSDVQLVVVTSNRRLTSILRQESKDIWRDSRLADVKDLKTPFYANIFSRIFKSFL